MFLKYCEGYLLALPRVEGDFFNSLDYTFYLQYQAIAVLGRTGIVFGWAKPVPINPLNFRNPRKDTMLVSLAGPVSNILTAIILGLLIRFLVVLPVGSFKIVLQILFYAFQINVMLAIFNMIPIPPLDGSKILFGLIPSFSAEKFHQFERVGPMLLMALIIVGPLLGIPILSIIITPFLSIMNLLIIGPNTLQIINFMLLG